MRRLPLLEILMVGVVVLACVILLRSRDVAERLVTEENRAFAMLGRLHTAERIPEDLSPVADGPAFRHAGYLFVAYAGSPDGPQAIDLATALASQKPHLLLAWPERYGETGRRTYILRPPGYILRSGNERDPLGGLPVPPCPWPSVEAPKADPPDPEEGVPEFWIFGNRHKQRSRLEALGLWRESFDLAKPASR